MTMERSVLLAAIYAILIVASRFRTGTLCKVVARPDWAPQFQLTRHEGA